MRSQKALVCGASGFLGNAVCRRLCQGGAEVHAVSRVQRRTLQGVRWWQADLTEPLAAARLLREVRPDIVFNLSGISDGRIDREHVLPLFVGNALSAVNLLSAVAEYGCERLLHCSSLQEPDPGSGTLLVSPYALSKWVGSAYVDLFNRLYALPSVVLRLGVVYGPGEASRVRLIPYVITSLLRAEPPQLSSGEQLVDWLYLDDAVDVIISATQAAGAVGKNFNVGSGAPISVHAVVQEIARAIDNGVSPLFGALPDRPLVPTRPAEPSRLALELGWHPRTSLQDGLRATIEWYREKLR